ncbi:MAG: glycosyltransferase family 39 protein [Acidobacteriaceae bacterium]
MATSFAQPDAPQASRAETPRRDPFFGWTLPALGVVSLIAACVLWSIKKPFAGDENFTRVELADPSFTHLMRSALHLGGGGMPLFYLTAWPWAHVFGLSELSLRLYSCLAVCAAFLVLGRALERRFGGRAAFLGAAFGLFASLIVIDQNVEARGYGLYLLLAAIAAVEWLRVAEDPRPRLRDLALLALTQAGLVLGHVLGLLYAVLMLLALIAADRLHHRFRPRVYAWLIAGWLALVPWIPAIRASAAVGRPHTWIPVPAFADLAIGFSFWLFGGIYYPLFHAFPLGLFAGWLGAILCVAILTGGALLRLRTEPSHRPALLLGLALLLAPLAFFVISRVLSPIYVARYMIPSALGIVLLAVSSAQSPRILRRAALWSCVLLTFPVAAALLAKPVSLPVARIDQLAAGQPLVCDWLDDFLAMTHTTAAPLAPQYPLDWQAALDGPPAAVGAYHLMENYRQAGYLTSGLRDLPAVLDLPSFVVLDSTQTNWFHLEIENNPEFSWRVLAQVDKEHRVIAVQRKPLR